MRAKQSETWQTGARDRGSVKDAEPNSHASGAKQQGCRLAHCPLCSLLLVIAQHRARASSRGHRRTLLARRAMASALHTQSKAAAQ